MSIDNRQEDEGHSTPEIGELEERSLGGRLSASPVIHLGPDGGELYEDGEPVKKEEEDYYLNRLERLLKREQQNDSATWLQPSNVFIKSVKAQTPTITSEQFHRRSKEFLREFGQPPPSTEILDRLFHLAIQAQKQILAWDNTVGTIKGDEFNKSLECLRGEVARFETIRKVFRVAQKTPSWMSPWKGLWIEAFEELEEEIEAQLRGAKSYLERLSELAKLGRTDVESQVLLLNDKAIKEVVAGTPLSKPPFFAHAVFAYAARLVRSKEDKNDRKGKYVNLIKARIKRAKCSKARTDIWVTLLMGGMHGTEYAEKKITSQQK